MSDTHYCKLHKKMPLRNFYDNAFSLVGNANISTSIKKKNVYSQCFNLNVSQCFNLSKEFTEFIIPST